MLQKDVWLITLGDIARLIEERYYKEVIHLFEPENLTVPKNKLQIFKMFAQGMLNRLYVGELRYGPANKKQRYDIRLVKEVQAYKKTGNAEHLINIANYCCLEWQAPGHAKHHFNPTVESVTRESKET